MTRQRTWTVEADRLSPSTSQDRGMPPGAEPDVADRERPAARLKTSEPAAAVASVEGLSRELRRKTEEYKKGGPFGLSAPVVWSNVVLFVVLHAFALTGLCVAPYAKWQSIISYIFVTLFSGLGVTAGAHRLWAHKSYKARLPVRIMLMCFNCISMQNDLLEWTRDHRVHHKYTETDADPHNAKRGFFFAHIGWLMMRKHPDVFDKGRTVDISDLKQDGVVMFQHRFYLPLCILLTIILPTVIPWYCWGESYFIAFFHLFALRYVLTLHATWFVNSAAHLWGSRNYDKGINPSDNRFVCYAAIGEGFHNFHHTFPYDYATSEWGPSLNITTTMIDLWAAFGQVYDRKQVSQEAIERVRRRIGDLSE